MQYHHKVVKRKECKEETCQSCRNTSTSKSQLCNQKHDLLQLLMNSEKIIEQNKDKSANGKKPRIQELLLLNTGSINCKLTQQLLINAEAFYYDVKSLISYSSQVHVDRFKMQQVPTRRNRKINNYTTCLTVVLLTTHLMQYLTFCVMH